MNRRKFFGYLGKWSILAAAPSMPWRDLLAAEAEPHYFMHLQIEGSLDMLAAYDPYVGDLSQDIVYKEYLSDEVMSVSGLRLAPPAAALAGHAKDICVVNGIWMSVGGLSSHEACRVYMSSGESKSTRSAATILPFEVAANMTRGPFQVVVNNTRETWNARRSNIVPQVLNPAAGAAEAAQVEKPAVHGLLNGIAANGNSTIRDTLNAYINAAEFRQQYETYMAGFRQEGEVEFEHAAASAFLSGASYQAFYNLGGDYHPPGPGLDNHSGYVNVHAERARWFMEKISAIFDLFKSIEHPAAPGKSLFDLTTFVVTNEFSKPAQLLGDGKDHNTMTNSVLFAGKNVRGGQTIGASTIATAQDIQAAGNDLRNFYGSSTALFGLPFDFKNQTVIDGLGLRDLDNIAIKGLALIKPENVAATVRDLMGINRAAFQSVAVETPAVRGVLKG